MSEQTQTLDFPTLCEQHGDEVVTVDDSLEAGNCRYGTTEFRDFYFASRDSLTIRELVPYLTTAYGPFVRKVLEYKLAQLGVWTSAEDDYEGEPVEDTGCDDPNCTYCYPDS